MGETVSLVVRSWDVCGELTTRSTLIVDFLAFAPIRFPSRNLSS